MISYETTLGTVSLTSNYFAELVSTAVQNGFGVAGLASKDMSDTLKTLLLTDFPQKGIRVIQQEGKLIIDIHMKISYGLNICAAVKSITHQVQFEVEEASGLPVKRINVLVDDIVA